MNPEASVCNLLEHMLVDKSAEPKDLPLSLLKSITNNFSDYLRIGSGGFAVVYKGLLQNGEVAVKKLFITQELHETKFCQEVDSLMRVKHENIVRFLGYCSDTQGKALKFQGKHVMAEERQRFLCFEFMPQGSLDKYIRDPDQGLEWMARYRIIKGICEGLHYLHHQKIVHLDLKPANILLDHNMVPKIADFGLSKCFYENQTRAMTSHVFGSLGYMAPESYGGLITFKSDIYSLGIIIIEILTGRKGCPETVDVLGSWSTRFETSLGDIRLEPVRECTEIAIDCTHSNPDKRPDTRQIIERLVEMERKYGFMITDLFTSSATNPESTSSDHKVKLELMGRVKSIPSTIGANEFPVLVRVTAPLRYTESSRIGLDLVAVLGVNESMTGRRLESMKQAMMFVIDNLGPDDRLSIVSFNNETQRLTELSLMTDVNREIARHSVRKLQPGGDTNIHLALNEASKILGQCGPEERCNRVGRIIFLTDTDDESFECQKFGSEFPVETFGLSAHHTPDDLVYIASNTGGVYSYVTQDLEKIKDAFAQSLGGLMSVTAMDVQVNLHTLNGVTMSDIDWVGLSSDKRSATIQVPDLYAGEQKNFIVYLDVPEGKQNRFVTVSGSYRNPQISKEATIQLDDTELVVLRPEVAATPSDETVCPDVAAELIRLRLIKHLYEDFEDASLEGLDRYWEEIKGSDNGRSAPQSAVLALDEDVANLLKENEWFNFSWISSQVFQRATTKGSPSKSSAFRVEAMEEMLKKVDAERKRFDVSRKLVHLNGPSTFTADNLMGATAEIMGKCTYWISYKLWMKDGSLLVVKQPKVEFTKDNKEFEAEAAVLGKIRHPNLLALRAYNMGPKGENLLVFDYMPKGSLFTFLHARAPNTPVYWATRMMIAKGMARGLVYLHDNKNIIHGNLTARNVLLDEQCNPKIADINLTRLLTAAANSNVVAAVGALGYRAPELSKLEEANAKTDVYSLGVIVLELLTGKSPADCTNGMDLLRWVASILKEERTREVFDLELMREAAGGTVGEEHMDTLKVALQCVDTSPSARPEAREVLRQLEQIRPGVGWWRRAE